MAGLFDGTPLERPVTCERCEQPLDACACPRDAEGRLCLPRDQQVRVSRERRSGGRWMTIVSGLDPTASDLPGMLKHLKLLCAGGGAIKNDCIELQGDHREQVVAELKSQGYAAKTAGG